MRLAADRWAVQAFDVGAQLSGAQVPDLGEVGRGEDLRLAGRVRAAGGLGRGDEPETPTGPVTRLDASLRLGQRLRVAQPADLVVVGDGAHPRQRGEVQLLRG